MPCRCGVCQECNWAASHPEVDEEYERHDTYEGKGADLLLEIAVRCAENAKKHGGPEHDDTHALYDAIVRERGK